MVVKRTLASILAPSSPASRIRQLSFYSPFLMFVVGSGAIVMKQSYFRNSLADEDVATTDRIERRSYVALPNGKMAQVYPVVETDLTIGGIWNSAKNALNLLP